MNDVVNVVIAVIGLAMIALAIVAMVMDKREEGDL